MGLLGEQLALANQAIELGGDPNDILRLAGGELQDVLTPNFSTPDYSQTIPYGQEFDKPMTALEERLLRINERRDEGNVHSNPLSGIFDAITGAQNPNSEFQTQGLSDPTLTGDIPNPLETDHPIYGSLGDNPIPSELPTFQNPTQDDLPAATVEELPQTIAQIDQAPVTEAEKDEAKQKVVGATSAAMAEEAKVELQASGATPEQLSGWDKFTGDFDLATIGMALLASNDGSSTFSANLGKAMMMGKEAKKKQGVDLATAAAAARKETRDEKKVDVEIANAHTNRLKALAAQVAAAGNNKPVDASKAEVSDITRALGRSGDLDTIAESSRADMTASLASLYATELQRNPNQNRDALADKIITTFGPAVLGPDTSTFGGVFGVERKIEGL